MGDYRGKKRQFTLADQVLHEIDKKKKKDRGTNLAISLVCTWYRAMNLVMAHYNSIIPCLLCQTWHSTPRVLDARRRQIKLWLKIWSCGLAQCEGFKLSIIVELVFVIGIGKLLKVELVTENGTDTTETLDELVALGGTVRDELKGSTKVAVLFGQPFE